MGRAAGVAVRGGHARRCLCAVRAWSVGRHRLGCPVAGMVLLPLRPVGRGSRYATVLLADIFVAALFAASLHFIPGPGCIRSATRPTLAWAPMVRRCWRAAACPWARRCCWPPGGGGGRAALWLVLRAPVGRVADHADAGLRANHLGHRLQWDGLTGGSNGPDWRLAARLGAGAAFYWLVLFCRGGPLPAAAHAVRALGLALRAGRDSATRAEAIGINVRCVQWAALPWSPACWRAGGRAVHFFSKGGVAPEVLWVGKSVDGLVRWCCWRHAAAGRPAWARRPSPGCTTAWPAPPTTGALLAASCWRWCRCFHRGISGFAQIGKREIAPKKRSNRMSLLRVEGLRKSLWRRAGRAGRGPSRWLASCWR